MCGRCRASADDPSCVKGHLHYKAPDFDLIKHTARVKTFYTANNMRAKAESVCSALLIMSTTFGLVVGCALTASTLTHARHAPTSSLSGDSMVYCFVTHLAVGS